MPEYVVAFRDDKRKRRESIVFAASILDAEREAEKTCGKELLSIGRAFSNNDIENRTVANNNYSRLIQES